MKRVSALLLCTALVGCQAVPGEGPLAGAIVKDAGQSGAEIGRQNATVFDIVEVDGRTARLFPIMSPRRSTVVSALAAASAESSSVSATH